MCEVRFEGNEGDLSESRTSGEAAHIAEARAALTEFGLDMTNCTWNDIVEKANAQAKGSWSLSRFIFRCFPFLRPRRAI